MMDRDRDDDLARSFLMVAAALTPARRREWSQAMLAELSQVSGTAARWRFTLGTAAVMLVPPGSGRVPAMLVAAVATAAAIVIHVKLPSTGLVTAIAFPGLPAAAAWAALAWPRRPPRGSAPPAGPLPARAAGYAVQAIAVATILACPLLALREMVLYPGNAGGGPSFAGQVFLVVFAAEPAGYLLLILRRPGVLRASRLGGLFGLAAAEVTGAVVLRSQPPGATVALATVAVPVAAGLLAGIVARGGRAGLRQWLGGGACDMLWGWLLIPPAWFAAAMLATSRGVITAEARLPANIQEAHQQGATSVAAWVAQDDLGGAIFMFTVFTVSVAALLLIGYVLITSNVSEPAGSDDAAAA